MIHKKPERIAWLVIWGAFASFLLLCTAIPVSARSYLLYSHAAKPAAFDVLVGTPRVQEREGQAPIAVTKSMPLSEGSAIDTDENSKGFLTFHDGSTLTLFPSTQVTLREMRVSNFEWGRVPITFKIDVTRGRVRVSPAPLYAAAAGGSARPRVFEVTTPHLTASLAEGSYAVDVYPELSSQLTANMGRAEVIAQGQAVTITTGQRTVVTRGNPPLPSMPAALNLIVNGDFLDPLARGWVVQEEPGTPGAVPGQVDVVAMGDRLTLHIQRANSGQTSAEAGVIQSFTRDVSDLRVLKLTADIRLHYQSLSGGGILSSEYPLILRLKYRDQYGSENEWVHGFYYQNTTSNPTNNGELVPVDVWVPFESGNLFEILDPKPFFLTSLRIYASGWDYESNVTNVKLLVE